MKRNGKGPLDPTLVAQIEQSERDGGIFMKDIPEDTLTYVHTRNTLYTLAIIDGEIGKIAMEGGKHFPLPEICYLRGSTFGGSMLKIGWVGKEMCLEVIRAKGGILTTSFIRAITIEHDPSKAKEMVASAQETEPKQLTGEEFSAILETFITEKFPKVLIVEVRAISGQFSLNGQALILGVLEAAHRNGKFFEATELIADFMREHWAYQHPDVRGDPNFTAVNSTYITEIYRILKLPLPQ